MACMSMCQWIQVLRLVVYCRLVVVLDWLKWLKYMKKNSFYHRFWNWEIRGPDPLPLFLTTVIPYSGKLWKKKTFTNFVALETPVKVFSSKNGHAVPTYVRVSIPWKVFYTRWSLLPIHKNFLPWKFLAIQYPLSSVGMSYKRLTLSLWYLQGFCICQDFANLWHVFGLMIMIFR